MWRHLFALSVLLAAPGGPAPAGRECLIVTGPRALVTGGSYTCVTVAATAAGATLEEIEVTGAPTNGLDIDADDVTIRRAHVHDNGVHGLLVRCRNRSTKTGCADRPKRLKIEASRFEHNGGNGIKFEACEDCEVTGSLIAYNDNSGAHANDVERLVFSENELAFNGNWTKHYGHGLYFGGRSCRLERNDVHHNQGWGIHLWPGPVSPPEAPYIVRDNRAWRNGSGGMVQAALAQHVDIRGNDEFSNGNGDTTLCALGQRPGTVIQVVGASTIVARLVLSKWRGREHVIRGRLELADVDAPRPGLPGAAAATAWVRARLRPEEDICVEGGDRTGPDGRPLVVIYDSDGDVGRAMLRSGLAAERDRKARQ